MKTRWFLSLLMCIALTCGAMAPAAADTARYPVVQEPVTYTAMFPNDYVVGDPSEEMPLIKQTEEITNIHFDWTVISSTDKATQISLMLASGDIPDVSFSVFTDADVLAYGPIGMFLALDPYIETAMPNLYTFATQESAGLLDWLTLSDGHIYTLPKVGAPNVPTTAMAEINNDWLTALALEMPTTTDELFDILVAFKERDPNGNGLQDEIPLTWCENSSWMTSGQLNAWFGVTPDLMIRDGVVTYSPVEDGWKQMVLWLNKCWDAGLMDIELFTQDSGTFGAKAKEGLYGVFQTYAVDTYLAESQVDSYRLLPPLDGGGEVWGAYRQRPDGYYMVLNKGIVSTQAEHPEHLLAALDLWYGEMGFEMTWGPLGIVVEMGEDGLYKYVDNTPPEGYATRQTWWRTFHWNQWPSAIVYRDAESAMLTAIDRLEQYEMAELCEGLWINEVMPYNFQTVEESEALNAYLTDISKYVKEMYALWVVGERDVEADWDGYIAQLESMGVREYIATYQAYYDRICR